MPQEANMQLMTTTVQPQGFTASAEQLRAIAEEAAFLVYAIRDTDLSDKMREMEIRETLEALTPLLCSAGLMELDGSLVEQGA